MSATRPPLPSPTVRRVEPTDAEAWVRLRDVLWPGSLDEHRREVAAYFETPPDGWTCLVAEVAADGVIGFVEVGMRAYAEGCRSSPVGYVEGLLVAESHRKRGMGRALVHAAERWAGEQGCTEMASDRETHNEDSGRFHAALDYEEVERIVCFRKSL